MTRATRSEFPEVNLKPKYLIKVDDSGAALGIEEKEVCHAGDGVRHKAYLVMIFDERNRLMLARRSRYKTLWPGFWDGTAASHYYSGESHDAGVVRRIAEETGLACPEPKLLLTFAYEARYEDVGIEKEVCDVFLASGVDTSRIPLNPAEISECRFADVPEIERMIAARSLEFAPWFVIAFRKCRENGLL
jgi:isopentenyl-diphosphate Delta-isomerase